MPGNSGKAGKTGKAGKAGKARIPRKTRNTRKIRKSRKPRKTAPAYRGILFFQELVDFLGGFTTAGDGADNEARSAGGIAGKEDVGAFGTLLRCGATLGSTFEEGLLGTEETHSEEDDVTRNNLLVAVEFHRGTSSPPRSPRLGGGLFPDDALDLNAFNVAVTIVDEAIGVEEPTTLATLLVA